MEDEEVKDVLSLYRCRICTRGDCMDDISPDSAYSARL